MDETSFLAEIDADSNVAPKLIFADWLEERGDTRADYIRAAQNHKTTIDELRELAGIEQGDGPYRTIRDADLDHEYWHLFAADCAERQLPIFEFYYKDVDWPRLAIEAGRTEGYVDVPAVWGEPNVGHPAYYAAYAAFFAACASNVSESEARTETYKVMLCGDNALMAANEGINGPIQIEQRWRIIRFADYKLFGQPVN